MKNTNQYYQNGENLRFTMVTAEQEKELFLKAREGDQESREFLIRNHLLFCANFGRKRNRGALPEDEVISAVNEALMKAIDSFNPGYGSRFTRYLIPFLRGAIANLWKSKNIVRVPTPKDPEFSSQSRFSTFDESRSVAGIRVPLNQTNVPEHDNLGKSPRPKNIASTLITED
jgi:DNA-directed RNA polymerase sigma subunit (sigma70/sigma32)